MPSYAVLGATGRVGQSVLKVLLQDPQNEIHAYCRSKQKLLALLPELSSNPNITIYQGNLTDTPLLASCLAHTTAAFLTTAPNGNQPHTTIACDTARLVVSALETLSHPPPRLILLSSSSTDHSLMTSVPWLLRQLLYCANYHIYEDLKRAEEYLLSRSDFVPAVFIKPGALSVDRGKGYTLSVTEARSPVSYLDLAAGMVEVGGREGEGYVGRGVAVNATAGDVEFPWEAPGALVKGLVCYVFPWAYAWLH